MLDISELDEYIGPHDAREPQDLGNEPLMFTPPYANNVVIQIAPASSDVRSGNYNIAVSSSDQQYGPAGQQPDEGFSIGYNVGGSNSERLGENALGIFIESHYVPYADGSPLMEFQIRHILKDGTEKRPLHIAIDKATGTTTWLEYASTYSLFDPITGAAYFGAAPGQWSFAKGSTGGLAFFDNTSQWLVRPINGANPHSLDFLNWNTVHFNSDIYVDAANAHFAQDATITRNLFINTTATGGGAGVISIGRAITAPTTNPANACILYTDPADNVVKIRDTAGVVHALW